MEVGSYLDKKIIEAAAEIMEEHPRYGDADRAVRLVFDTFRKNDDIAYVLAKVSILNSLYATSIFDVIRVARHICGIKGLDNLLSEGSADVVDLIRRGHGV